jgi:hypothetical protein
VDTVTSGAEYLAFGAAVGTNGRVYTNGWGGNQFVSTAKIADIAGAAGNLVAVVSTGMDAVAWHNGIISGGEFSLNLALTGVGFMGPQGAAFAGSYYLVDTFYPGGAQGALIDYGKNVDTNQKIVPEFKAVPTPPW